MVQLRPGIPTPNYLTKNGEILGKFRQLAKVSKNGLKNNSSPISNISSNSYFIHQPKFPFQSWLNRWANVKNWPISKFFCFHQIPFFLVNDHKIFFDQKLPTHEMVNLAPYLGRSGGEICNLTCRGISNQKLAT